MNDENKQKLFQLTKILRRYQKQALDQYINRTSKESYEPDFYHEVKPFADQVEKVINEWKPLVLEWIQKEKPEHIFSIQVNDAYDNFIAASVLVFQKDARRKRLREMLKSIDYLLEMVDKQLG